MADTLCGVCNTAPKKYKCPTCALPYCSLPCFKQHKPTHADTTPAPSTSTEPNIPQPPAPPPLPRYLKKTDFAVLATNPAFTALLESHPALLPALQRVYAVTIEPDEEPRRGRGGFRGRGRGRGRGGGGGDRRWTQKQGDADAMALLKGMRGENAEEREALAAFVGLVLETAEGQGVEA